MTGAEFRNALAKLRFLELPASINLGWYSPDLAPLWRYDPFRAFFLLTNGDQDKVFAAICDDDADRLRATATRIRQFETDRRDHDLAIRDAISETARCADELAFWRYQAIFARAYMLRPAALHSIDFEDGPEWKEAERQLEANRAAENRERSAHAEAPRDPSGT